ncbi:Pheromone B beta 1 receptor [Ceratobasidium theobromae]|uniref:Pheromone B beta 1 receptor n=1 Tax=Ceratobasidium theobromae TaxID=1582974 RepID=A0A5N5QCP2_9AGAM|nr:Pheromone B beta 1 receptor [Ceratobasidium theobromae]
MYWRTRNFAVLSTITWLVICNIIRGVNSAIWTGNTIVKYKIWCDISIRLIIGASFALPASILCICRSLAEISSARQIAQDTSEKRRRMIFELSLCVEVPIVLMALCYVVLDHRFAIVEDYGCAASLYMSVPAVFIIYISTIIPSLGALIYAGIALRSFIYGRARMQSILQSSQSGFTTGLYVRFIILSIIMMFYTAGITLFVLIVNVQQSGLKPWTSWDDVHSDFQYIPTDTRARIPQPFWDFYLLVWLIIPISSVLFFVFFGFGREARLEYVKFFRWVFRIKQPVIAPRIGVSTAEAINLSFRVSPAATKQTETMVSGTAEEQMDGESLPASIGSRPPSPNDSPAKKEHHADAHAQVRHMPAFRLVTLLTTL